MMVELIVAHPDTGSFNHAIAETCLRRLTGNGHEVVFHDLYKERFDPLLSAGEAAKDAAVPPQIEGHCGEIQRAQGIVIVHPNWWGQPPAILKGWIDRVLRAGVAYEFLADDGGEGIPLGLLKAERALVFNTSNTEQTREMKIFSDPLETLWKKCVFDLCGVKIVERRTFSIMVTSTKAQREEWLREAGETVERFFPPTGGAL